MNPSTRRPALILVLLALAIGAAFFADPAIVACTAKTNGTWRQVAQQCSRFGDWPCLAALALGAGILVWLRRDRGAMKLISMMFLATLLAGAIVLPLRAFTGRARPHAPVESGWHGPQCKSGEWVAGRHHYSSFPSAHTAIAAAFVAPLVALGPRLSVSAWAVVLLIGWSRVYLGVHHLSDVTVGAILGRACGFFVVESAVVRWWISRFISACCEPRRIRWVTRGGSASLGTQPMLAE